MSRRLAVALAILATGVGFASWRYGHGADLTVGWSWILMAWLYTVVGLFAWQRRPDNRTGKLMVLTGLAFWVVLGEATRVPLLWTLGSAFEPASVPALGYLLLSFPNGRLSRRLDRVAFGAGCLILLGSLIGSLFYDPRFFGCTNCQPHLNLILIGPSAWWGRWSGVVILAIGLLALLVAAWLWSSPATRRKLGRLLPWAWVFGLVVAAWQAIGSVLGASRVLLPLHYLDMGISKVATSWQQRGGEALLILILLGIAALFVSRWWGASRPAKRALSPMLLPAVALFLALATQRIIVVIEGLNSGFVPPPFLYTLTARIATWAGVALPLAFLLGLWLAWARRARVGELVVELGDLPPLDKLEQALSRALGDPSLTVGRWDPGRHRYVTSGGLVLDIPEEGGRQVATFLEREGMPLAAVVHDPALLQDPGLLDSVSAAARLVVDNERLQAEIRAQLEEVRASRARIVAAADEERYRLERDLHDGAQQRLASLALSLKMVESKLDPETDPSLRTAVADTARGLGEALQELRELARGIHPSVLTEEGLGPALQSLAERSAVPVRLLAVPKGRFGSPVESAAYFVVSEALANAAKHAGASEATVAVRHVDSRLVVEVGDDGMGGADPAKGTGLRGLGDRVAAVEGRLEVKSSREEGTRVVAELPCESL
jgi:signal transduction histidine kinase